MQRVLIYVEPHPIRDTFEEFHVWGSILADAMQRQADEVYCSIFSNNQILDHIGAAVPSAAQMCIRPTDDETAAIAAYDGLWNEERIETWLHLTQGKGTACALYESILDRIYALWPFDGIVLWAENGAVRNFAARKNLFVIHGELGATRAPFPLTMYLDPNGTNGNAAVLSADLHTIMPDERVLPATTWRALAAAEENNPEVIGLEDAGLTLVTTDQPLPSKPYIFIPLQLADDLNLLAHSEFQSPQHFLEQVLPPLLNQGFDVVIKGHPGAPIRSYNLLAETRALEYASQIDGVTIIPRTISSRHSLNVIQQSAAVITINSSVGFEALLLGKRVVTMGRAAYDIGGKLFRPVEHLYNFDSISFDQKWADRLVSFLCCHYFIPRQHIENGAAIVDAIKLLGTTGPGNSAFWSEWVRTITYGYDDILHRNRPFNPDTDNYVSRSITHRDFWDAAGHRISLEHDKLKISILSGRNFIQAKAQYSPNMFTGHIDQIVTASGEKEGSISGWAAVAKTRQPPIAAMLLYNKEVIEFLKPLASRPDVSKHLGTSSNAYGFVFRTTKLRKEDLDRMAIVLISDTECAELAKLQIQSGKAGFLPAAL